MAFLSLFAASTLDLSQVVTTDMVTGVFSQIISLIPIIIPAIVGFIGIRKGLAWLIGALKSA